jgi:Uma2 family endonuclease
VTKEEIRGVPDLISKLLPGTQERDRSYKKALYTHYGVREYRIVNPHEPVIEAHKSQAQGLQLDEFYRPPDLLVSVLIPALEIDLDEAFQAQ